MPPSPRSSSPRHASSGTGQRRWNDWVPWRHGREIRACRRAPLLRCDIRYRRGRRNPKVQATAAPRCDVDYPTVAESGQRHPTPPFSTDTLLQAAGGRFGWSPKKTSALASLRERPHHVHPHRLDTARSRRRREGARGHCRGTAPTTSARALGRRRVRARRRTPHEAIRPTRIEVEESTTDDADATSDGLIRAQVLASQMASSVPQRRTSRGAVRGSHPTAHVRRRPTQMFSARTACSAGRSLPCLPEPQCRQVFFERRRSSRTTHRLSEQVFTAARRRAGRAQGSSARQTGGRSQQGGARQKVRGRADPRRRTRLPT
ncbi:hypothetical protein BH23GEM9_BH23GEM9_08790 [soil metagenome]